MLRSLKLKPSPYTEQQPSYLWLPGWSFHPEVFLNWAEQLPGTHWGLDWSLIPPAPTAAPLQLTELACQLAQDPCAQAADYWIGWSLGGLLATLGLAQLEAATSLEATSSPLPQVITLGSSLHFINQTGELGAFQQALNAKPAATLKHFARLCCSGSAQQRQDFNWLSSHQMTWPSQKTEQTLRLSQLQQGLQWLEASPQLKNFCSPRLTHWAALAGSDPLCKQPFKQAKHSQAAGHSFFLNSSFSSLCT